MVGIGLELVVGPGTVVGSGLAVAAGDRVGRQRHERAQHDFLAARGDEPGVHQLDLVDVAGRVQPDDVLADGLGVVVARLVAEAVERLAELVAAELEVALGLLADRDDLVALAGERRRL